MTRLTLRKWLSETFPTEGWRDALQGFAFMVLCWVAVFEAPGTEPTKTRLPLADAQERRD
jgi:hypothetical protein